MTLEEIKQHWVYTGLDPKQRVYVIARCLGKDKFDAAKEAFECNNEESYRACAYRAERNEKIVWIIKEFQGGNLPTCEEGIRMGWSIARESSDAGIKLKALNFVAKASGWGGAPPTPPNPPTSDEGDKFFEFETDEGTGSAKMS